MPIKGLSELRTLPRLGKIRLGKKVGPEDRSYPRPTDFFVVPPEVQEVYGPEPRELDIMFPTDDENTVAGQWLRCYSATHGLLCIGDGEQARAKIDLKTGTLAARNTEKWEWHEGLPCDMQECPEYQSKRCRRVMNLQFLLPKVPGLGVWQVDTSSFHSIRNINSMLQLVRSLCGRINFIPLTLCLGPIEVSPAGMSKKTVYVMHIKQDVRLADLLQEARKDLPTLLSTPPPSVDEPPDDLYPPEVLEGGAVMTPPPPEPVEVADPQDAPQTTDAAGCAPPETTDAVSDQALKDWARIRALQADSPITDDMIKKAFKDEITKAGRKDRVAGNLTDTPPKWALPVLDKVRDRMESYIKSIKSPPQAETEEPPAGFPPVEDVPATTEEKRALVQKMKEKGMTDEGIRIMLHEITGRKGGWTKGDLALVVRKLEERAQPEVDEVEEYLKSVEDL